MAVQTTRTIEEMEKYCARLRAAGLDAPWSRPGPLIPPKPTATQPRHWRWRDIEPLLRESSEFLSPHPGAERRGLRLPQPRVPPRTPGPPPPPPLPDPPPRRSGPPPPH